MSARPLNDDEVLSEMNKMVRAHPGIPTDAEAEADALRVQTSSSSYQT